MEMDFETTDWDQKEKSNCLAMWNFVAVNRRYPNFLGGSPLCLHSKKGELGESEYVLDHDNKNVSEDTFQIDRIAD